MMNEVKREVNARQRSECNEQTARALLISAIRSQANIIRKLLTVHIIYDKIQKPLETKDYVIKFVPRVYIMFIDLLTG